MVPLLYTRVTSTFGLSLYVDVLHRTSSQVQLHAPLPPYARGHRGTSIMARLLGTCKTIMPAAKLGASRLPLSKPSFGHGSGGNGRPINAGSIGPRSSDPKVRLA